MSRVKQSLTRKFGPLPAWAWALILGAVIYIYRSRQAVGAAASTTNNTGTPVDNSAGGTTPQDPVTLSPGESVYDPNTGQLIGTAPEQQDPGLIPPADPPIPQDPILFNPGQEVYDPNTGKVVGGPAPKTKKPPKKTGKRKPKPKSQHAGRKSIKKPGHTIGGKSRLKAVTRTVTGRAKSGSRSAAPQGRTRGTGGTAAPRPRARINTPPTPALRQRPAAPKVVSPVKQRVAAHPAKPAPKPAKRKR